jgi:cell division protein FtsZ
VVDPEANIIFGIVFDPEMENEVRITLIATGFNQEAKLAPARAKTEELRQIYKGLEDEHALDIPSFMRQPLASRHSMASQIIKQAFNMPT